MQAGVRYAAKNPYSYVHANVVGHVTLLEAIVAQRPLPRLVYASSSSVYGLNTKQPFAEGDRVDNPASLYASTKRVRPPCIASWKAPALERGPRMAPRWQCTGGPTLPCTAGACGLPAPPCGCAPRPTGPHRCTRRSDADY